ncbi:Aminotran-1-2 domain-containing protein [Mycena chlorophos]|uniref:Aminotran-1-2 domain-containing protein n=1 Tax=Mycena chlorophos TaxID=658473 RepID=A0A8H6VNG8_MYCCL|nr:Aminotran-1-2 domain-containing protein [Mycena chlorophos]
MPPGVRVRVDPLRIYRGPVPEKTRLVLNAPLKTAPGPLTSRQLFDRIVQAETLEQDKQIHSINHLKKLLKDLKSENVIAETTYTGSTGRNEPSGEEVEDVSSGQSKAWRWSLPQVKPDPPEVDTEPETGAELRKYFNKPGLIGLAGGLPAPAYFLPFTDISSNILVHNSFPSSTSPESTSSWLWKLLGAKEKTTSISVPLFATRPEDINLATALQYGLSSGLPQLNKLVKDFSKKVYQPAAYENWTTLLHAGNTGIAAIPPRLSGWRIVIHILPDAWNKVVLTLCNPGEGVLVSMDVPGRHGYDEAVRHSAGHGRYRRSGNEGAMLCARYLPTGMKLLWGCLVLTCSIPCRLARTRLGLITGLQRLLARFYQICVEFDLILQEGTYVPKAQREVRASETDEEFIASLEPSYPKYVVFSPTPLNRLTLGAIDYQGSRYSFGYVFEGGC